MVSNLACNRVHLTANGVDSKTASIVAMARAYFLVHRFYPKDKATLGLPVLEIKFGATKATE